MLSQDVCLSVCLSVTRWYCVKTVEHIIILFSLSGSHTILVFTQPKLWQHSDGNLHFICEMVQDRTIFTLEHK